jgi:MFS superfamily sulfate permease-like transporter
MKTIIHFSSETLRKDAQAGIITGLMAIPLTIGICIMSDYPIQTGLTTVIFACLISFLFSIFKPGNYVGTPGVAAGLAPVLALGVHEYGMENMAFIIFLTAFFQGLIWHFNWQRYILKAVPHYLVEGLLAGVGIKIALKFLPYTWGGSHLEDFAMTDANIQVMILSALFMGLFLYLFTKFKVSSPGLPYIVVIVVSIILSMQTHVPMLQIDSVPFELRLPMPHFLHLTPQLILHIVGFSLMLATIDVIEQVMSNAAIEKIDPYKRPCNTNNSLLAIWVSNMGASFFGGMTNLDGLAKSTTNAIAGAVSKVSNLFTGLVLLIFVLNHELLEYLPFFSLAVLMIFSGWKMVAGVFHIAGEGKYEFMLALFCAILVFKLGIFEGLIIALLLHALINYVIYKHHKTPTLYIIQNFLAKFIDEITPHFSDLIEVDVDPVTKGFRYRSIKRHVTDSKNLSAFIDDWGHGINSRNLLSVINTYDYQALLWGTFAKELHNGHSNIKKYFDHLFHLDNLKVRFMEKEVRQYGEIYIQSGTYEFSYTAKGQMKVIPARYSFVCKRESTGWYILEHHSSEFPA